MTTLAPSLFAASSVDEGASVVRNAPTEDADGVNGAWSTKEKTLERVIPFSDRSTCITMNFPQHPGVPTPAK